MSEEYDEKALKKRMEKALEALSTEFGGLRTGRASASLLDNITVMAYGAQTPLNQIGSVSVPEPRMLAVNIWDKVNVGAADRAIRDSGLGLNPVVDGTNLRIPIPPLNEERRAELAKIAGKYAEQARISVRNVRRDGMDSLKKMQKAGDISEDEQKVFSEDVQKLTDQYIKRVDEALKAKEEEIMQV
ncbi:ribosome recycling factor [Ponticaulis sp.]|uniref:ribosome recycling factor n=1 Tax=Ponticaulis sp. TaxID=2020902 RepID=UPI000C483A94|nr:ribosome recycling factor [Ponticaulis sp.]MAJ08292.1 ribosome recycling factor [Ponticaulis sp.]MDF1681532.1 ribosome recycling factor [Ponticaulis sp.]HBH88579.1 ribosome recycling factor [Hyphomonadaceae bacterium]|tara:strand:- start:26634 stop:27194 length:561 start_codon:yes stop_codon:yes gene_type:complete